MSHMERIFSVLGAVENMTFEWELPWYVCETLRQLRVCLFPSFPPLGVCVCVCVSQGVHVWTFHFMDLVVPSRCSSWWIWNAAPKWFSMCGLLREDMKCLPQCLPPFSVLTLTFTTHSTNRASVPTQESHTGTRTSTPRPPPHFTPPQPCTPTHTSEGETLRLQNGPQTETGSTADAVEQSFRKWPHGSSGEDVPFWREYPSIHPSLELSWPHEVLQSTWVLWCCR